MNKQELFEKEFEMKKCADAGDADAQYELAWYCQCEAQETRDKELGQAAEYYYKLAAEQGNLNSALDLGGMYLGGDVGVPSSFEKAIYWYEYAAKEEYPKAFRCLGYALGFHGFQDDFKDLQVAYKYFEHGARLDEPNCLYELGKMYANGWVVEKDPVRAVELYQRSYDIIDGEIRDDSYADTAMLLGICYLEGQGVEQNLDKAKKYLTEAREGYEHRLKWWECDSWTDTVLVELDKVNRLLELL